MTSTRGAGGRRSTYTTSTAAGGGGGAQESSMPSVSPGRPIRGLARTKVRHMDRPPFGVNNARRLSPALSRSLPNSNDGGARSARTGFFPDRDENRSPRHCLHGEECRGGPRRPGWGCAVEVAIPWTRIRQEGEAPRFEGRTPHSAVSPHEHL